MVHFLMSRLSPLSCDVLTERVFTEKTDVRFHSFLRQLAVSVHFGTSNDMQANYLILYREIP